MLLYPLHWYACYCVSSMHVAPNYTPHLQDVHSTIHVYPPGNTSLYPSCLNISRTTARKGHSTRTCQLLFCFPSLSALLHVLCLSLCRAPMPFLMGIHSSLMDVSLHYSCLLNNIHVHVCTVILAWTWVTQLRELWFIDLLYVLLSNRKYVACP